MKRFLTFMLHALLYCSSLSLQASHPFFSTGIAITENGELLLSQKGTNSIVLYSADGEKTLRSFPTTDAPTGVVSDGNKAYVTTFGSRGALHILNLATGSFEACITVGSGARFPMLSSDKRKIYVCNQFEGTISEIDLNTQSVSRTVRVLREPKTLLSSKDGKYLFVSNFLPVQRATDDLVAASVSVIETDGFTKIKDITLVNGSNALKGMCITPDGRHIYVVHNLGRFMVPTSQVTQGWMNTSALSIIDVEKHELLGTILLDEPERGAAGVWDIKCNNEHIFVTHSGTHDISMINHQQMLERFLAHPRKEQLSFDLNFLFGLRRRLPIEGNGPREMYLTDNKLYITTYFADILNILDLPSGELSSIAINPERIETIEHRGYKAFNDADKCLQNWQSCNGCHPGDGRMDGLNWDLLNDGIGNPKNCKSLLFSHITPPSMISGIRPNAEAAVRAGFRFIQFFEIDEETAASVDAYLKSLRPVPSPLLVDGKLSEKAEEGRKIFEKLKCNDCHPAPYYTDQKLHRIGENIEFEAGWDTPTLIEVWRTAPYLFDGSAKTMDEVFSKYRHGIEEVQVSQDEINALVEYVNSL